MGPRCNPLWGACTHTGGKSDRGLRNESRHDRPLQNKRVNIKQPTGSANKGLPGFSGTFLLNTFSYNIQL